MKEYLTFDALVVGSGAAGYNAACRLKEAGLNAAIVTECVTAGTSRNAGSDKQTYYKLGLGGGTPDSVWDMARDLFAGGSVDGDNALCEAALSARCFFALCEAGVRFPSDGFGEYVGYKTDHDPRARATSAGPLTSKDMTEALEKKAHALGVPVLDGLLSVKILKQDGAVTGLLALDQKRGEYRAFRCGNVILCTGGPAGIYADSVYPFSQTGASSLALEAGAALQNATEWQYGLASVAPRWNVSGTYMQVLPAFVSVDEAGEEREFLADYFADPADALSQVFLKGYQWPFDSAKVLTGSSVIDLLVYRETVLNKRKVYLDYRKNPFGLQEIPFASLAPEAREYLEKADAAFGTPIERLHKMNEPAVELYRSKGVDLETERLEIALSAQHHNGGIAVDLHWQTEVPGLFAAGECAGTHGVVRPGGSALNAGQVGSLRAAEFIARRPNRPAEETEFSRVAGEEIDAISRETARLPEDPDALLARARRRMSDAAGVLRNADAMETALAETEAALAELKQGTAQAAPAALASYFKLRDALVTQHAVLAAMLHYAKTASGTRGSALYTDPKGELREGLGELFRFTPEKGETRAKVQETRYANGKASCRWRPVRPLPQPDEPFETVWAAYRKEIG